MSIQDTLPSFYRLVRHERIASTNDEAKTLASRRRAGRHFGLGARAERGPRPSGPELGLARGQSLSLADLAPLPWR